ncbi:ATP-binding protein [Streptomyces coffeae]|uniref:LuxR family transcriptional regulator n=1 Tax=Streptomyces coffeae TaxID=621382 RepID=A0ABS1NCU5_9ACTN|nr:LuxR C-terminal-related transcriptional regulator [Streptomyces coffeae]MBL1097777.1 LuxR family transcriptional regulator [Streptomyces coffeae]
MTGAGGIGKTRLALRIAGEVRRSFPGGVWVVDLSAVGDGALLAQTVLAALGRDQRAGWPPQSVLAHHLADQRLLLVLDNCEHLLDECAALTRTLLAVAPGLRVLATSRQVLTVEGERLMTVPPLRSPYAGQPPSVEMTARYEAVQLFVDRASAVIGGFALNEDNHRVIAHICRRLDGIPLAIELAAARIRVLCPQQILDRLDDHFALLNRGSRAAPKRRQTLRAAIDWSYGLCTADEQQGWDRLSVFGGGFDLAAAEAICGQENHADGHVLELITGLVDKSILTREEHHDTARYRMLETIRQYGRAHLREEAEETALRRRHRDYLPARAGLQLLTSLWNYVLSTGNLEEQRPWLRQALALDHQPSPARAKALWIDGWLALLRGETTTGRGRPAECRALAEHLGSPEAVAHTVQSSGLLALFEDDLEAAASLLALAGSSQARAAAEDCLARCDAHDARWSRSYALWLLGLHHWLDGDSARAIPLLHDGLRLARTSRDLLSAAQCLEVLAWAAASEERWEPAATLLGAAQARWRSVGIAFPGLGRLMGYHTACEGRLRHALGDAAYATAVGAGEELSLSQAAAYALGRTQAATPPAEPAGPRLTRREQQVTALLARGLTDKEIAAKLVISPRTAQGHVHRILAKLGVSTRTQVATWAMAHLVQAP